MLSGKELLTIRPDFATDPRMTGARFTASAEAGPARRFAAFPGKAPVHQLTQRYILRGQEIQDLIDFHAARAGKWEDFFVPSWFGDIAWQYSTHATVTAGTAQLVIDWCNYAKYYGPIDGDIFRTGRHVFALWPDGTFAARKVTAVAGSVANDYDLLTVDAAWPQDISRGTCLLGFCYLVRFSSDELEVQYKGNGTAEISATYIEQLTAAAAADVA